MTVYRRGCSWLALGYALLLFQPAMLLAQAQNARQTPLTTSQVVDRMEQKNAERARDLERYQGRRFYRLDYAGFPETLHAEMVVDVTYSAPDSKEFKIVSESGSKWVITHILKRLLKSENEALEASNRQRTILNRQNYDFTLVSDPIASPTPADSAAKIPSDDCRYILSVQPKVSNKFVYRGRIWVDAKDFAVCRIEAEPAQNPSFWIRQTQIHHAYIKVGNFWFPSENKSVSNLRLGGRATLTIQYTDYKILQARSFNPADGPPDSPVSSLPKPAN